MYESLKLAIRGAANSTVIVSFEAAKNMDYRGGTPDCIVAVLFQHKPSALEEAFRAAGLFLTDERLSFIEECKFLACSDPDRRDADLKNVTSGKYSRDSLSVRLCISSAYLGMPDVLFETCPEDAVSQTNYHFRMIEECMKKLGS